MTPDHESVISLQNTDRKIIDIALEVVFNNLSYFINRFKKTMGYTCQIPEIGKMKP